MIGLILRHQSLLKKIIEGHITRVRPSVEYMTQIMKDMDTEKNKDLKELCYNKETR